MASAWGGSWGAAWGNSWGTIEEGEPTPEAPSGGGSGPSGKKRRELQQIADEDEILIAFVAAFFQVVVN